MDKHILNIVSSKVSALYTVTLDDFDKIKNIVMYGHFQPREFVVDDDKKLVYLVNSKVACSSIKACMCGVSDDDDSVHSVVGKSGKLRKHSLTPKEESYYRFTFVRDPFVRLVSCYESKYHNDKTFYKKDVSDFDKYLFGYIKKDEGFDNFVRKIVKIPDCLLDKHISIQSKLVRNRSGKLLVDYIGHMETLSDDFRPIAEKYGLPELPHFNRTDTDRKNWMDYYTLETAKLVYDKYRKDIKAFGYTKSYRKLRAYLKKKESS